MFKGFPTPVTESGVAQNFGVPGNRIDNDGLFSNFLHPGLKLQVSEALQRYLLTINPDLILSHVKDVPLILRLLGEFTGDSFKGNYGEPPNPRLWEFNDWSGDTGMDVFGIVTALRIHSDGATTREGYLQSKFKVRGDFDVECKVKFASVAGSSSRIDFNLANHGYARDETTGQYEVFGFLAWNGSTTEWKFNQLIADTWESSPPVAASGNYYGMIRFTRTGSSISMYYRDNTYTGDWTLLGTFTSTTDDMYMRLGGSSNDTTYHEFADFVINAGEVVWPMSAPADYFPEADGSALGIDRWEWGGNCTAVNTTIDSNRLRFDGTLDLTAWAENRFYGDFDIEVQFDVLSGFNSTSTATIELRAYDLISGDIFSVLRQDDASNSRYYMKKRVGSWSDQGFAETTDSTGRLRLIREGNKYIAQYYNSSTNNWTEISNYTAASAGKVRIVLGHYSADSVPDFDCAFSDYRINSVDFLELENTMEPMSVWWDNLFDATDGYPDPTGDSFTQADGTPPNEDLWWNSNGPPTTISSNAVPVTCTNTANGQAYETNFRMRGDFEVIFDFANLSMPATYYSTLYFGVYHDYSNYLIAGRRYTSAAQKYIVERYNDGTGGLTAADNSTDTSGQIKLERVGSTITAYRWNGSWVQIGAVSDITTWGAKDVFLKFGMYRSDSLPDASADVTNFSIVSGEVIWDRANYPWKNKFKVTTPAALSYVHEDVADDFSEASLNTNRWSTSGGIPPVIDTGKLKCEVDTSNSGSYAISEFLLRGDFDIQVDFEHNGTPPAVNDLSMYTQIYVPGSATLWAQVLHYYNAGNWNYYFIINAGNQGGPTTTDTSGKFRFVRSGSNISAYKWNGSSWDQIATTQSVTDKPMAVITAMAYSGSTTAHHGWFDNFKVNDGHVVWSDGNMTTAVAGEERHLDDISVAQDQELYVEYISWDQANREALVAIGLPVVKQGEVNQIAFNYNQTATTSRLPEDVNDDFSQMRTDLWDYKFNADRDAIASYASVANNRLELAVNDDTSLSNNSCAVVSKFALEGDFDIEIDFEVVDSVEYQGGYATFCLGYNNGQGISDVNNWAALFRKELPSATVQYKAYFWNGSGWSTTGLNESGLTGKMRYTRVGEQMTAYYWNGSSWTQVHTYDMNDGAPPLFVGFAQGNWGGNPAGKSYINSFTINSVGGITGFVGKTSEIPARQVWDNWFLGVWLFENTSYLLQDSSRTQIEGTPVSFSSITDQQNPSEFGNSHHFDTSNYYTLPDDNHVEKPKQLSLDFLVQTDSGSASWGAILSRYSYPSYGYDFSVGDQSGHRGMRLNCILEGTHKDIDIYCKAQGGTKLQYGMLTTGWFNLVGSTNGRTCDTSVVNGLNGLTTTGSRVPWIGGGISSSKFQGYMAMLRLSGDYPRINLGWNSIVFNTTINLLGPITNA